MSNRDMFAAAALTGILSSGDNGIDTDLYGDYTEKEYEDVLKEHRAEIAAIAYSYADAMLKARQQ